MQGRESLVYIVKLRADFGLIAEEAIYHHDCYVIFRNLKQIDKPGKPPHDNKSLLNCSITLNTMMSVSTHSLN